MRVPRNGEFNVHVFNWYYAATRELAMMCVFRGEKQPYQSDIIGGTVLDGRLPTPYTISLTSFITILLHYQSEPTQKAEIGNAFLMESVLLPRTDGMQMLAAISHAKLRAFALHLETNADVTDVTDALFIKSSL